MPDSPDVNKCVTNAGASCTHDFVRRNIMAMSERKGILQNFFDFYSVFFGVTAPPPQRQKLILVLLIVFFVLTGMMMFLVAELASSF